jgi:hypothetical protein
LLVKHSVGDSYKQAKRQVRHKAAYIAGQGGVGARRVFEVRAMIRKSNYISNSNRVRTNSKARHE